MPGGRVMRKTGVLVVAMISDPSPSRRNPMSSRLFRSAFLGLAVTALAAGPCYSQGKGHGKDHEKHDKNDDGKGKHGKYEFRSHDRDIVTSYFAIIILVMLLMVLAMSFSLGIARSG